MRPASYGSISIRPSAIRRRIVRSESTIAGHGMRSGGSAEQLRCGTLLDPVSMLFPSLDPNEQFRSRRGRARRAKRRRRALAFGLLLLVLLGLAGGMTLAGKGNKASPTTPKAVETISQL